MTGPVVGRVNASSAIVLLEVDLDARVEFAVCLIEKCCPGGREIQRKSVELRARRPGIALIEDLLPEARYVVCFGGVHRSDAVNRYAEFVTPERAAGKAETVTRFMCVAHDRPTAVAPGEFNRWETIRERVERRELPQVNFMIHLGGQVELKRFFEEAWVLLKRGVEQRSVAAAINGLTEPWEVLEARAAELLRDAYRFAWNLPGKRQVLANCPHFMLCGEDDVYPRFTEALELSPAVGGEVASTMLRLARRVYWEYQRQLWDPRVAPLIAREEGRSAKRAEVANAQLRASRAAAVLKAAKVDLEVFRKRSLQSESTSTSQEQILILRTTELEADVVRADKASTKVADELEWFGKDEETAGAGSDNETALHILGSVGILVLDTRWSQVDDSGAQLADAPLVPESCWAQLENLLLFDTSARDLMALVVAVDEPPLDPYRAEMDPKKKKKAEEDFEDIAGRWSRNEADQRRFVGLLLKWLHVSAQRSMLVVCGGDQPGGVETTATEESSNVEFRQICVGSVTGAIPAAARAAAAPLLQDGGDIDLPETKERLVFEHCRLLPADHCAYLEGAIGLPTGGVDVARFEADICSLFYNGVKCLLGPIIGLVTESTAIVLIEVAYKAPVACVVTEVLTGKEHKQITYLGEKRPHAFSFEGLTPARHYTVHFTGIEYAQLRRGQFCTPALMSDPERAAAAAGAEAAKTGYAPANTGDGGGSAALPWQRKFRIVALAQDAPYPDHEQGPLAPPIVGFNAAERRHNQKGRRADFAGAAEKGALLLECCRGLADDGWPGIDLFLHCGGQVDMDMVLADAVGILARAEMAMVRGDAIQAGRLEDAALDRLRDGYRTHWNLPGTRELLAAGSHVMLRGDKDLGTLLLREGAAVTSLAPGMMVGSVRASQELRSGYVYRTVRRLSQRVYREYQRQLWEPLPTTAEAAVTAAEYRAPASVPSRVRDGRRTPLF